MELWGKAPLLTKTERGSPVPCTASWRVAPRLTVTPSPARDEPALSRITEEWFKSKNHLWLLVLGDEKFRWQLIPADGLPQAPGPDDEEVALT